MQQTLQQCIPGRLARGSLNFLIVSGSQASEQAAFNAIADCAIVCTSKALGVAPWFSSTGQSAIDTLPASWQQPVIKPTAAAPAAAALPVDTIRQPNKSTGSG